LKVSANFAASQFLQPLKQFRQEGVCINHGAKRYCTMIDCGKALFQTGMCRHHFRECLLVPSTIDMRHVGLHATVMDITDLT
jgi:hypothetical protein